MQFGRYRHYKGNEYTVIDIARHSETMEELVVYRAEYGERGLWVRPRTMFEEWIEKEGVVQRRFACEEPPRAWPESLRMRIVAPDDAAAIRAIHERAYATDGSIREACAEAWLVEQLTEGGWGELSLLATLDGQPVGHLMLSRLVVRSSGSSATALALAPVGVLPEHQRQGIGSALVRASLDLARQRGWSCVLVLGDSRFYARFGFRRENARGYQCVYQGEHLLAVELAGGTTGDTGAEPTGEVDYPAPFARL
jgi:putative acetyltransferase